MVKELLTNLTAEYLRSIIDYDPETGIFTWKHRADRRAFWNNRYAGTKAGCADKNGYHLIVIRPYWYRAHRLAWLWMTGEWPKDQIDHIDRNPGNNRWNNLRAADAFLNMQNKGPTKHNKCGYKGIFYKEQKNRWTGNAKIRGVTYTIGYFDSPEEAHFALENKRKEIMAMEENKRQHKRQPDIEGIRDLIHFTKLLKEEYLMACAVYGFLSNAPLLGKVEQALDQLKEGR